MNTSTERSEVPLRGLLESGPLTHTLYLRLLGQDMTHLNRVVAHWYGFLGAPATSTFYSLDTSTFVASLREFFNGLHAILPTGVTIECNPSGDIIEDTTGEVTGGWVSDPVEIVAGSGSAPYAAPVGMLVNWHTTTILDGHRVRGKTFIVPTPTAAFEASGKPGAGSIDVLQTAAITFLSEQADSAVIWHRPYPGRAATPGHPARDPHDGGHGLITASSVPAFAAVLRSRRD